MLEMSYIFDEGIQDVTPSNKYTRCWYARCCVYKMLGIPDVGYTRCRVYQMSFIQDVGYVRRHH